MYHHGLGTKTLHNRSRSPKSFVSPCPSHPPAFHTCLNSVSRRRMRFGQGRVKGVSSSREEEVRNAASEDLIRWVEDSGETLIRESIGSLVVSEIMLNADGGLPTSLFFYFLSTTPRDKTGAAATLLR